MWRLVKGLPVKAQHCIVEIEIQEETHLFLCYRKNKRGRRARQKLRAIRGIECKEGSSFG